MKTIRVLPSSRTAPKVMILPYKMGSESARTLARALGVLRIRTGADTYRYRRNHIILNWGNSTGVSSACTWARDTGISTIPPYGVGTIPSAYINEPSAVYFASNKIETLCKFNLFGVARPAWTVNINQASDWVREGNTVYCRTTVTGSGGDGIVIATSIDEIVDAKLYTQGVNNDKEYRVHVFNGEVIDFVRKAQRRGEDNKPSHLIRNYKQGWVFIREGVQLPEVVAETAKSAVQALGLTFGAVDICTLKGTNEQECVVFEVNTACGLVNSTIESYKSAILKYVSGLT